MTARLYLVRHGETDWNAQARLQGRRDIPLNRVGRNQARSSGACLSALLKAPEQLDFVCSPLSRARETMEIVRTGLNLEATGYRTSDRLVEIDFGEWEGLTYQQVAERDPRNYQARQAAPLDIAPPGGESYRALLDRIALLVQELRGDTVIVAHAGVLRGFLVMLAGVPASRIHALEIPQDEVLLLEDGEFSWLRASSGEVARRR